MLSALARTDAIPIHQPGSRCREAQMATSTSITSRLNCKRFVPFHPTAASRKQGGGRCWEGLYLVAGFASNGCGLRSTLCVQDGCHLYCLACKLREGNGRGQRRMWRYRGGAEGSLKKACSAQGLDQTVKELERPCP